jgi:hypothetical protein
MTTILLFVEHELNHREVTETLEALAGLRVDGEGPVDVSVLVPRSAHWPVPLMDDVAAAHGTSVTRAVADGRHDAAVSTAAARRILRHALTAIRGGGHAARGELVSAREAVRDLATEAAARRASTALVVSSPHRFSHLLHHDLEHRLRRAGIAHVIRLPSATIVAPVTGGGDGTRPPESRIRSGRRD